MMRERYVSRPRVLPAFPPHFQCWPPPRRAGASSWLDREEERERERERERKREREREREGEREREIERERERVKGREREGGRQREREREKKRERKKYRWGNDRFVAHWEAQWVIRALRGDARAPERRCCSAISGSMSMIITAATATQTLGGEPPPARRQCRSTVGSVQRADRGRFPCAGRWAAGGPEVAANVGWRKSCKCLSRMVGSVVGKPGARLPRKLGYSCSFNQVSFKQLSSVWFFQTRSVAQGFSESVRKGSLECESCRQPSYNP